MDLLFAPAMIAVILVLALQLEKLNPWRKK